ncbi:hypothetical protein K8I61_04720 [bacterium]|nr:hypothetical protein [bacterium]
MSRYFSSSDDFYKIYGAFFARAASDAAVGSSMKNVDMILRLSYQDPEAFVTLHVGDPKAFADGRYLSFELGDATPVDKHKNAQAEFAGSADFAHRFWLGLEEIGAAIVQGKIAARGNFVRALTLVPTLRPAFKVYRETLKELGYEQLVLDS